jgi:hypothetical protein
MNRAPTLWFVVNSSSLVAGSPHWVFVVQICIVTARGPT